MTREQRAEYAEWCRQRANDLQLLELIDWQDPELEKLLTGEDHGSYQNSAGLMDDAADDLKQARLNYVALAERLEANAD